MRYRKVGRTDVEVSEISLGCWTMGGLNYNRGFSIGWAEPDEAEVIEAVRYAVEAGVNHFDNADAYGNGVAERLLAKALEGVKSDNLVIATKVGHFQGTAPHAYTPLHIRHQCEQSLENLRRHHIDIYYFHHGNFGPNDQYLDGAIDMMRRLRSEGKIRLIGLSAYSNEDFLRLIPKIEPDVLQAFANLMDDRYVRPGNPVPDVMEERGLSMVTFSPLNQGILLDKYDPDNPPRFQPGDNRAGKEKFTAVSLSRAHAKLAKVKERFGATSEDLERVALQFLLGHRYVCCPIPGFRNSAQVRSAVAAADRPLTAEDVKWLRDLFSTP